MKSIKIETAIGEIEANADVLNNLSLALSIASRNRTYKSYQREWSQAADEIYEVLDSMGIYYK